MKYWDWMEGKKGTSFQLGASKSRPWARVWVQVVYWGGVLVKAFLRNRTSMYISWLNWLTWWWRLRSPMIYCLQAADQEGQWCNTVWVQGQEIKWVVPDQQWGRKKRGNSFFLCLLFCSGCQWIGWYHPLWGRQSTSLSPLIQMLVLSGNTA